MRKSPFRGVCALVVGAALTVAVTPPAAASPIAGAPTVLVSSTNAGTPGNDESSEMSMSADGRYVAFVSKSTNLAPVTAGIAVAQVYRKDLVTGEVVLVSANGAGESADREAGSPSISADGMKIAFVSDAGNLVAEHVDQDQVYVRDLTAPGGAVLITRAATGHPADQPSWEPAISADGTRVAFTSSAPDLVPGATSIGQQVLIATTLASPVVSFVSVNRAGDVANTAASEPSISQNGSVVTFTSAATNLTSDPHPAFRTQIWQRNLVTSVTTLVSIAAPGGGTAEDSTGSSTSADGTKVAYMVGGRIELRDLARSTTTAISVNRLGGRSNGSAHAPVLSGDGMVVAFKSNATDLAVTSTRYGSLQFYRRDLRTGTTVLVSSRDHEATRAVVPYVEGTAMSSDGAVVAFSTHDPNVISGLGPVLRTQIYAKHIADPAVDRVSGADRFAVAAGLAAATYGAQRDVVYVATGADFPDALSASAAAGTGGGPVLLVMKDAIPTDSGAELARLAPAKIVIAGGPNTISPAVETALGKYAGEVVRISGADRFEVSASMSASTFKTVPVQTVYLASGAVFPDALAGAAATRGSGPVLLVSKDSMTEKVRAELTRLAPSKIVVLGGPNTISDALLATLPKSATVSRMGGADRYVVSANVSAASFGSPVGTAYVASGAVFPDALSGSAAAIADRAPVLLVTKDSVPDAVAAELTRLQPRRIVVLGGTSTVSDAVQNELGRYVVG